MAMLKILTVAMKAQRSWRKLPPARRQQMIERASREARRYGPIVAKRIQLAVKNSRKAP